MRAAKPQLSRHFPARLLAKHGSAVHLAGCFLSVSSATAFALALSPFHQGPALIWLANGVVLAYLLLAPRWRWPAYLATGYVAQIIGGLLVTRFLLMSLTLPLLGVSEAAFAAFLLRKRSVQLPNFTDRTYLLRFGRYALLFAPVAAGAIFAFISHGWYPLPWKDAFLDWAEVDSLGIAVVTPAFVAILQTRMTSRIDWKHNWLIPALLAVVTLLSFSHPSVPLLSFIYPLLMLILISSGIGRAALATLFVATLGGWFTTRGIGMLATSNIPGTASPVVRLQLFIASGMFMLYAVSIVLERQKATERRLQKIAALHAMVTDNSRDAILIADFEGNADYVSPAIEAMTGWSPKQFQEQGGARATIHPDDFPQVEKMVANLRTSGRSAMAQYRVRKWSGEYLWVEASTKALTDPITGILSGTLNILRDITDRKQAEKRLQDAYLAVETLALTDGLTGLANRRRFDQCLSTEWRRALRDQAPLSMLLIDVDLFKSYNDSYGHLQGDTCLQQIAETAMSVVSRPADLIARFGGEEFAAILPNTTLQGAMEVALAICRSLRSRKIRHQDNPTGIVTVSVGCVTIVPSLGLNAQDLIGMADDALYKAKRSGRNQVCNRCLPQDQALNYSRTI